MKRFFVFAAMAVSALSASFPSSADATCYVGSASPIRVNLNSNGTAYIYFHPHALYNPSTGVSTVVTVNPALSSNYWRADIPTSTLAGAAMVAAAVSAVEHQTKILIISDAAACPATNISAQIGGNVTTLVVNP